MNNIRYLLFLILVASALMARGQQNVKEREGEPDIYNIESDDEEMNQAIKKSRATFPAFATAFDSKKKSQSFFSIKIPFPTEDGGAEHIWLSEITKIDGKYYGEVDNVPDQVSKLKVGQKIEIDPAKISDWFYIDNGKLVGGLTIGVIRDRMTPDEKKEFDQEFGVAIE